MSNEVLAKCKAKTKKGAQCKARPLRNGKYCYVHSIGKFKYVPFARSWKFHSLLFALVLACIKIGPSAWEYYLDNRLEVRLNREFASGWAIYTFDGTKTFIPKVSRLSTDYTIDWQTGNIELTSHDTFRITFPAYDFKGVRFWGNTLELPTTLKSQSKFHFTANNLDQSDYLVAEILDGTARPVEFVMGFVPR